ncbi:MAG: hypothetical protein AABX63_04410 [Nanoarchaeota archaeon]
MEKKGAVEIQFNWILVLVIGAVVIIIFMGFISNQQGVSAISANILTASSLDAIFHGYEGIDISDAIGMPKSKINFDCDSFSINGISKQLGTLSVFSPVYLETDKLNILSFGWDMPYRITNFVYITSPDVRYVFIGNSDFAREVFEKAKGKIRADGFTNIRAVEDENDRRVRLIFFEQNPEMPESLNRLDLSISALKVDGDKNSGTLEFFDFIDGKFESRGKSYYVKEASLFGAVFSDGIDSYKCNMEKGFDKLKIISQIYNKRINEIMEKYNTIEENNVCRDFYQDNLLTIFDSISYLSSFDFKSPDYENIIKAADEIEKINNEADALSCTLIY